MCEIYFSGKSKLGAKFHVWTFDIVMPWSKESDFVFWNGKNHDWLLSAVNQTGSNEKRRV